MNSLIFATNNAHKLEEVQHLLEGIIRIQSLKEMQLDSDIPETSHTLEGNAAQKAEWIYARTGKDCFADDTGLEVDILNGEPGVYSARYAGEGCSFDDNIDKLLKAMEGASNRNARFRTVICLIENGKKHYFEGVVKGEIITERYGDKGFGYDPVFIPENYAVTFAEMPLKIKNEISHRSIAVKKLVQYLRNNN